MKITKIILFIFCLLQMPFYSNGQLYIARHLNSKVILGPDNVSETNSSIYAHHMKELKAQEKSLQQLLAHHVSVHKDYTRQKKSKAMINDIKFRMEIISNEINTITLFQEKWKAALKKEALKFSFFNEWEKDSCYVIKSKSKKYFPGEYEVKMVVDNSEKSYREFFSIILKPVKKVWRRVRIEGCQSTNAIQDCYVDKLVDTRSYFYILDYLGDQQEYNCPADFSYSQEEGKCIKTIKYFDKNPYVEIIDKQTGEIISITSWKKKKCD